MRTQSSCSSGIAIPWGNIQAILGAHAGNITGTCWTYLGVLRAVRGWVARLGKELILAAILSRVDIIVRPVTVVHLVLPICEKTKHASHPLWFDFSLRLFVPSLSR